MISDPISSALSLRVSVTDRCQLRCQYCMPPDGIETCERDEILAYEEISALVACLQAEFGLTKVRITGGEPLVRPHLDRLVSMLSDLGIHDIALTTNGLRLAEMAPILKRAGLRRVNVSLDSMNPGTFRHLTRGGELQAVLDGIAAAIDLGLTPVKLNTVVIRGVNDRELGRLLDFALENDCEIRFIELMPIGPGAILFADGFLSSQEVMTKLPSHLSFHRLPSQTGSSARRYQVCNENGNRLGTVGVISSCSAPFCGDCSRLRVTSDGWLIGCLAANGGMSIRNMLRNGDGAAVRAAVREVLNHKRTGTGFEQEKAMPFIGG